MSVFRRAVSAMVRALPSEKGYAHCDIPCGIYDPIAAKIAAQTVQKMVLRIQALQHGDDQAAYANTMIRYVKVKDEHAELCKHELRILWADYGWPNLPEGFDLHGSFNAALKLAGRCRQTVDHGRLRRAGGHGGQYRHRLLGHQGRRVQGYRRRRAFRHLATP